MRAIPHIITAVVFLQVPASTTANLWNGTWKLNASKSHIVPAPLAIEQTGSHYTLTQGGTYHFDCDGHDYPGPGGQVLRCTTQGTGLDIERTRGGKPAGRWELRPHSDGRTMTETATEISPGVPPAVERDEYRRLRPGKQTVAGSWIGVRSVPEGGDAFEFRIHDGYFYFKDVRDGEASDAKLDGTPAPFLGEGARAGVTWTNVLETERRYVGHALKDGKPVNTEVFEISPDGKSLKATQPGTPGNSVYLYERQ